MCGKEHPEEEEYGFLTHLVEHLEGISLMALPGEVNEEDDPEGSIHFPDTHSSNEDSPLADDDPPRTAITIVRPALLDPAEQASLDAAVAVQDPARSKNTDYEQGGDVDFTAYDDDIHERLGGDIENLFGGIGSAGFGVKDPTQEPDWAHNLFRDDTAAKDKFAIEVTDLVNDHNWIDGVPNHDTPAYRRKLYDERKAGNMAVARDRELGTIDWSSSGTISYMNPPSLDVPCSLYPTNHTFPGASPRPPLAGLPGCFSSDQFHLEQFDFDPEGRKLFVESILFSDDSTTRGEAGSLYGDISSTPPVPVVQHLAISTVPPHGQPGGFTCDFPGCTALAFQTQYLLK